MKLKRYNEFVNEEFDSGLKIGGHVYTPTTIFNGVSWSKVDAGVDGILSSDGNLLTWDNIDELEKRFRVEDEIEEV